MKYKIQEKEIDIDFNDAVFRPSPHGSSAIGNAIKIKAGEKVLDVGSGTGLLAILAAKLGAKVSATDILPEATELTRANSAKNDVSVDVRTGDLFSDFSDEKFDVIIANVPQENLSPKIIEFLSKEAVIGMHGGDNGNEVLLKVLKSAPEYMYKDSRLYVVVYSMSDFRKTLEEIVQNYEAKLISFYTGPVKEFVYSDLEWYLVQAEKGLISIYKNGSEYCADLFVFELKLK